jgi:heme-degrading monooxygenase HmoA
MPFSENGAAAGNQLTKIKNSEIPDEDNSAPIHMLTVGLYYDVVPGKENIFENMFGSVIDTIKTMEGYVSAILYRRVDKPNSYLIYSEWQNMESFEKFVSSREFSEVKSEGPQLLVSRPYHRIYNR